MCDFINFTSGNVIGTVCRKNFFTPADKCRFRGLLLFFSLLCSTFFLLSVSANSPLYPFNFWVDVNAYMTMGRGALAGKIPYLELFDHKGPLLYVIFSAAAWISGSSFIGVWLLEVMAVTVFLYFCGLTLSLFLFDKKKVFSGILLVLFAVINSPSFGPGGSVEELLLWTFALPFFLMVRRIAEGEDFRGWDFFICGGCFALVFWIKYSLCGFFFGMVLFAAYHYIRNGKWTSLFLSMLIFLLPFVLISAGILWWFAANNALYELYHAYFYTNIFQYAFADKDMGFLAKFCRNICFAFRDNAMQSLLWISGVLWLVAQCKSSRGKACRKCFKNMAAFFWLTVVFLWIGGFSAMYFVYYPLVFAVYAVFGVIGIDQFLQRKTWYAGTGEKSVKLLFVLLSVFIVIQVVIAIPVIRGISDLERRRESLVQYRFARIIKQKKDATLLVYNSLDRGFYLAAGVVPRHRIFAVMNVHAGDMLESQKEYIRSGIFDFIISEKEPELSEFADKYSLCEHAGNWLLFKKR